MLPLKTQSALRIQNTEVQLMYKWSLKVQLLVYLGCRNVLSLDQTATLRSHDHTWNHLLMKTANAVESSGLESSL